MSVIDVERIAPVALDQGFEARRQAAGLSELEWALHLPTIIEIESLKHAHNAVILAHNYQAPEIFHGVSDLKGDSLALAQMAAATDAEVIVLCGVHFMAETAKLLNPDKVVLIPDPEAGCSLAASITAADVRALKARHPGAPVVCYVNSTAEVKAESDICCTSANAVHIVDSLVEEEVIFIPDRFLGAYVAQHTSKRLHFWEGACEVHERFQPEQVVSLQRSGHRVLVHPECPPAVIAQADFVGSTAAMIKELERPDPRPVALITECSMSDNLVRQFPQLQVAKPCNLCPHMRRITLPKIARALRNLAPQVHIDREIAQRARRSVERMLAVGRRESR